MLAAQEQEGLLQVRLPFALLKDMLLSMSNGACEAKADLR